MRHIVYHNNKPVALNREITYLACTMELSVCLKESVPDIFMPTDNFERLETKLSLSKIDY